MEHAYIESGPLQVHGARAKQRVVQQPYAVRLDEHDRMAEQKMRADMREASDE
jgi:hypothetical protein